MCRIVRHHILHNFKVNSQELDRHFPKYKLIRPTDKFLACSVSTRTLIKNKKLTFKFLQDKKEYIAYLKHMSIIQSTYKPQFEEAPIRKDWLAEYILANKNIKRYPVNVEIRDSIDDNYSNEDFSLKDINEQLKLDNIGSNHVNEFSGKKDSSKGWK